MITIRPAVASQAKPLVGLYAQSGCGKTYSALLIAKGFTGDMSKVVMIETEAGRGEVHASDPLLGGYNVIQIRENFSPKVYGEAISAAEKADVECLIIDSASHEWEGVGGVLSMAADNEQAGKKGQLVWQKPKIDHQREFMLRLTQTPIPLVIVCMRARYPMEQVIHDGKKDWQRSKQLEPKQSEDILSEMFVHGWVDQEHRFHMTKPTIEAMRQVFLDNKVIGVDTGERLAAWSKGRTAVAQRKSADESVEVGGSIPPGGAYISDEQALALDARCADNDISVEKLKEKAGVLKLTQIMTRDLSRANAWIDAQLERRKDAA